jgi:hypothetical protein
VILTLGFANAAALGGEGAQRWEAAAALERQVLMTAPEDPDSAGAALLDALDTIRQGKVRWLVAACMVLACGGLLAGCCGLVVDAWTGGWVVAVVVGLTCWAVVGCCSTLFAAASRFVIRRLP